MQDELFWDVFSNRFQRIDNDPARPLSAEICCTYQHEKLLDHSTGEPLLDSQGARQSRILGAWSLDDNYGGVWRLDGGLDEAQRDRFQIVAGRAALEIGGKGGSDSYM